MSECVFLPAADGWEHIQRIVRSESCIHAALQVGRIATIDHHVDVSPQLPVLVQQLGPDQRVKSDECVHGVPHRRAGANASAQVHDPGAS
jgi:hypothetical protein